METRCVIILSVSSLDIEGSHSYNLPYAYGGTEAASAKYIKNFASPTEWLRNTYAGTSSGLMAPNISTLHPIKKPLTTHPGTWA